MKRILPLPLTAAFLLLLPASPAGAGSHEEFSAHWYDGRAELDGYRLIVSRYGQDREGSAAMVFVTEPFRLSTRVKADHPDRRPEDVTNALKLNLVRDFRTGIYDYNTMVSVFVDSGTFEPLKTTFTSAEWCGHVYEEMVPRGDRIEGSLHSYFEGESSAHDLERPAGGVLEDDLFILLRGLRGDYLEPGTSRTVPFLPGTFFRRLSHSAATWTRATISRDAEPAPVRVPAGTFETMTYRVVIEGGREGLFAIEAAYPHRIVRWSLPPDVEGVLTGSMRSAYWTQNREGDEALLERLGLE